MTREPHVPLTTHPTATRLPSKKPAVPLASSLLEEGREVVDGVVDFTVVVAVTIVAFTVVAVAIVAFIVVVALFVDAVNVNVVAC